MKKIKLLIISLLICQLAMAGIFGGGGSSGIGKLVSIVTKIGDRQLTMQIEQAKQGLQFAEQLENQVRQIQNQMESLRNEALNLKQLGKGISEGNLNSLEETFDRIINLQKDAKSLFYKVEGFEQEFEKIYSTDLELHGFLKDDVTKGIKDINKKMELVREQSRNAVYDAAKSADYSAKINADRRNIETILKSSATAEGALQAIQAGNNLLGSINQSLIDMKDILSSQIKFASTVQAEVNEVTASDAVIKENTEKEYEKAQNKANEELKEEINALGEIDITKWGK